MAAILGRLGSDQAGEVAAAAHMASAMLNRNGLTWADLLAPDVPPAESEEDGWRALVVSNLQYPGLLSDWEKRFLQQLLNRKRISPRQWQKVTQIAEQLRERRAW
ncbi:hypothetical protein [Acidisoma silvae]|uniref:Uncharacterized protein n=1 Tax=Acidisoma silvae TaxID=2802396 RepID=A0A963YW25_9PROT|nr:hypothetical protein [Acidisoma silvae]MCB8878272.1 hypothetical protein [Acidisoma silvae]